MKFAIYARKSTESSDKQAASIDNQIEECYAIANRDQLEIVDVYSESKSARHPGRQEFNKLLQDNEHGKIQGVLVWHINRLSRNAKDGGMIQWLMDDCGLVIRTPHQMYDKNNSSFMFKMETGQAEQYSKDLSNVVIRGNKYNFERGKWLGPAPQGYLNDVDKVSGEKIIVVDRARFDTVRKMWDFMLSGNYSPSEICRLANNDWGFTVRPTRTMPNRALRLSTLIKIFNNSFYYGLMKRNIDGKYYEVQGNYQPMITVSEFNKVQEILGNPSKSRRPTDISNGLNGSLIKCGECSRSITFESHGKYIYARCTKRNTTCKQKYIRLDDLDSQIENVLQSLHISDEFINWAMDYLKTENSNETNQREKLRGQYNDQLKAIRNKLNKLLDLYLEDSILLPRHEYLRRKREFEQEEAKLNEKLNDLHCRTKSWFEMVEETLNFSRDCLNIFKNGDSITRRHILNIISGSKLVLSDGKIHFEPVKPYSFIYEKAHLSVELFHGSP